MDADKIKEFFVFNVEKMILAVVVLFSVFLLYQGLQLPHFTDTHLPETLSTNANSVKSSIDEDHNAAIIPLRQPSFDIIAETKKHLNSVDPRPYTPDVPWEGKSQQSIVRRIDPALVAPRALIAQGVATIIALRSVREDYLLTTLEPADMLERIEAPKPRERRKKRSRGGGGMEDMMGMDEDEMEEESMFEMDDEGTGESMSLSANRKFNSEFDFGMPSPGLTLDKKHPKPAFARFIAGAAVIPHKEMYRSFEMALRDASGFQPQRDTPRYFGFEVQRADVTDKPVDQLVDADWVDIWDRTTYTKLGAYIWNGFAPEIVPVDYRDENVTTWIPPVLLDDYSTFSQHPLIPMKPQAQLKAERTGEKFELVDVNMDNVFNGDAVLLAPGQRPSASGMGMGMDEMDMGMEDMDEMGMGMGMGLGLGGGGSTGVEIDPVDYKLLRFYDFAGVRNSPLPGHQYVYRLRYSVIDPNFPADPSQQPKLNTLDQECSKRVLGLMGQAQNTNKRTFQRWTEWSEPCPPVSLPTVEKYFAGPIEPASTTMLTVGGKKVLYRRDPPKAKIVTSQLNSQYATRVPMRFEVTEGSVLSHQEDFADVVDPITLDVKKLPDAKLVSPTTIVDLDGAAPLSIADDITGPGYMLILDASGSLKVTDDIDDQEFYRIYSYADERGE